MARANLDGELSAATVNLLIADDHEVVRTGTRALLEREPGWAVVAEATDGRHAIELAREHRPDVCVFDLSMPMMNGLEATRRIRQELPETEVVIFSMHESEALLRDVLEAGARGYVVKSDAVRTLVSAVRSALEGRHFFSARTSDAVIEGYLRGADGRRKSGQGSLTPREREILQLLVEGCTNLNIAEILGIRIKTVETHRASIMRKLRLTSVAQLVRYAIRNHVIEP